MNLTLAANLIDLHQEIIYPARLTVMDGRIATIEPLAEKQATYILPGFVDAHVHVESSMLTPAEFARLAVVHGTVATVSDPHEIANVNGLAGVEYMIANGAQVPFKFNFGAPSCVPATVFETAGATVTADDIEQLFKSGKVKYLAEMMNWPGVLYQDADVYRKIALAHEYGLPVDGHAPGLRAEQAKQYIAAGISTDHECFTREEALDKLQNGMKILIREGSAARNFDALIGLLNDYPDHIMFCSDDKHPDSLTEGHINELVIRAFENNIPLFKALKAACLNPVLHYKLDVGLLRIGDPADFIVIDNIDRFNILQTYIDGTLVAENGKTLIPRAESLPINNFHAMPKSPADFQVKSQGSTHIRVIEALDGQLITNPLTIAAKIENGFLVPDLENDILKICVVNRYQDAPPAVAFIKNFGLKAGAIASSVAHDSHNIIAVGATDEAICQAVNMIIAHKGGVAAVSDTEQAILPLPVGGIMTGEDGYKVAEAYTRIDALSKRMGCNLASPFMTLSFMALLVIPALKLSDKGLFDGNKFQFVDLGS